MCGLLFYWEKDANLNLIKLKLLLFTNLWNSLGRSINETDWKSVSQNAQEVIIALKNCYWNHFEGKVVKKWLSRQFS